MNVSAWECFGDDLRMLQARESRLESSVRFGVAFRVLGFDDQAHAAFIGESAAISSDHRERIFSLLVRVEIIREEKQETIRG